MTQDEAFQRLNIEVDIIPPGSGNRPGTQIIPTHITIHNTSNSAAGADARSHARYIKGVDARNRQVSWHFTVDDKRCIKHLPTNEKAWHAGRGNSVSIGIEICENHGIDEDAAVKRGALLVAVLMYALDIPVDHLVTHKFWTGKDCPRVILRRQGGFEAFRTQVSELLDQLGSTSTGVSSMEQEDGTSYFSDLIDQRHAPGESLSPLAAERLALSGIGTSTALSDGSGRVAELERLVGRLMLENQQLRDLLRSSQDDVIETD
jgi:hypothetical protein